MEPVCGEHRLHPAALQGDGRAASLYLISISQALPLNRCSYSRLKTVQAFGLGGCATSSSSLTVTVEQIKMDSREWC